MIENGYSYQAVIQDFFPVLGVISLTLGCYEKEADEVQFNCGSSVTHLQNFLP